MAIQRFWINAPSGLQADHSLNGRHVLVDLEAPRSFSSSVRGWFASGDTISAELDPKTLSPGWPHVDTAGLNRIEVQQTLTQDGWPDKYLASPAGKPAVSYHGRSRAEAIGELVIGQQDGLGIRILVKHSERQG